MFRVGHRGQQTTEADILHQRSQQEVQSLSTQTDGST